MRISDWSSDVCSSDLAISVHDSIDPRVLPISHISINLDVRGGLDISEFVSRSHRLFARRGRLISRRRAISNTHGDICPRFMARRVMMTRCGALSTPAGPTIVASIERTEERRGGNEGDR